MRLQDLGSELTHELTFDVVKRLVKPLLRGRIEIHAKGLHNVPPRGPMVLVSNHRSVFDPFVLGTVLPRHVHFVAESWMGAVPILRALLANLGILMLPRERRTEHLLAVGVKQLNAGAAIGIFPEGAWPALGPPPSGIVAPFHRGVARLIVAAHICDLPIVPVGIRSEGESPAFRLPTEPFRRVDPANPLFLRDHLDVMAYRKVTLVFGAPLAFVAPESCMLMPSAESGITRVLHAAVCKLVS